MKYIYQLTFLRFLAALLVLIFHYGTPIPPFNNPLIKNIFSGGSIAVSFFFFLSGVVLAFNYLDKSEIGFKDFIIKRFARLYPVYLLAFFITLILGMVINHAYPKGGSIILQALSFHSWVPGICLEINFPSWSIAVEVFFYLLFPFILKILNKTSDKNATILILGIWIASSILHIIQLKQAYHTEDLFFFDQFNLYFPLWHLNTFLFGILCAKYIKKIKRSESINLLKPRLLYTIGTLAFFTILLTNNPIKHLTHNGLMSPIFFMIVAGLACDNSYLTKVLSHKFLVLLGNASYSMYIFQWPVYMVMSSIIGLKISGNAFFYLYLLILTTISIFIHLYFEAKMRDVIIKKWIK